MDVTEMLTADDRSATDGRAPLLSVRDLGVEFFVDGEWLTAAEGVSYDVYPGEVLAIVGESGSGKTQSSMSLLGLLPPNGRTTGSAKLGDLELVGLRGSRLRRVRGGEIAVIFQEPMTALNPVYTIGFQIVETLRVHFDMDPADAKKRAIELLTMVEIPEPVRRFSNYPHQLSGGQRQRAMIAQALACSPKLLVADEPTTALDVTVQAEILKLMRDLRERIESGIVLITHDMGVVADMADKLIVMRDGKVVERGTADEIFNAPRHPYTKQLLASVPHLGAGHTDMRDAVRRQDEIVDLESSGDTTRFEPVDDTAAGDAAASASPADADVPGRGAVVAPGAATEAPASLETPATDAAAPAGPTGSTATSASSAGAGTTAPVASTEGTGPAPGRLVVSAREMVLEYPKRGSQKAFVAVDGVNLDIRQGEVVGLVGESGSGKTTIGRAIVGLLPVKSGSLTIDDVQMKGATRKDLKPLRSQVGIVFQDPGSSLNPRLPIGESIAEPLLLHTDLSDSARNKRVEDLLDKVELLRSMRNRYPHELSGGQRQRVGIARALALEPKLLVADEPTSALDVSVQARVLSLFQDLQREAGFAALFISHDLAVVEMLSDRIAVMHNGKLVEVGETAQVVHDPQHPYTQRLLAAVPVPDPAEQRLRREARDRLIEAHLAGEHAEDTPAVGIEEVLGEDSVAGSVTHTGDLDEPGSHERRW